MPDFLDADGLASYYAGDSYVPLDVFSGDSIVDPGTPYSDANPILNFTSVTSGNTTPPLFTGTATSLLDAFRAGTKTVLDLGNSIIDLQRSKAQFDANRRAVETMSTTAAQRDAVMMARQNADFDRQMNLYKPIGQRGAPTPYSIMILAAIVGGAFLLMQSEG